MKLVAQFDAHGIRHHRVPALDNFPQKPRAHGVDVVRGKNPRGQEVDRDLRARMIVILRQPAEIQIHPKLRRIDAGFLDARQRHLASVDVVNGEKALDPAPFGHRRNQRRHPIIAVNQIRPHQGNDVVDDFPLEHQRDVHRFVGIAAVNLIAVIKDPVLSQMDVRARQHLVVFSQLLFV